MKIYKYKNGEIAYFENNVKYVIDEETYDMIVSEIDSMLGTIETNMPAFTYVKNIINKQDVKLTTIIDKIHELGLQQKSYEFTDKPHGIKKILVVYHKKEIVALKLVESEKRFLNGAIACCNSHDESNKKNFEEVKKFLCEYSEDIRKGE